jgi:hypothetical protein
MRGVWGVPSRGRREGYRFYLGCTHFVFLLAFKLGSPVINISTPPACSSPSHAIKSTGQRSTTSLELFSRALCAHMCVIAIALA